MMVDIKVVYTVNMTRLRSCVLEVDATVDGKDYYMKLAMEVSGIMMYHFTIESLAFYSSLLTSLSSFSNLMMS